MDLARDASRSPLGTQQAAIVTLEAAGQVGELSPGHAALLQDLQKRNAAITKGFEENPIATTAQNFPDQMKPPGPRDFSSAGALAGSLANRAAIAQFGALNWHTPALAVLDQADVKQVQAALQGPQGGTVLETFGAPELAKMLNRNDDPAIAQTRKDAITSANEEVSTLSLPPEKYYPQIDNKTDWIGDQLNGWIEKQVGAPAVETNKSEHPLFGEAGIAKRNWSLEGLVSDSTTASEIGARRPPSYMVAIMHNGALEILPGRITFNPAQAMTRSSQQKAEGFRTTEINRWAHGGDNDDFIIINTERQFRTTDTPRHLFGEAMP